MMKKIVLLITLAFLYTAGATAQNFELGKVTIAELEEKSHPLEPTAKAAILFEEGNAYLQYVNDLGFRLVYEVSVRIKIYNKDGYDWATKSLAYRADDTDVSINFSNAVTYNLVNGAIEKTKLKNENIVVEKIDKYRANKKITMPNVKEGSVIEYKFTKRTPYIATLPTWTFQSSVPVNYSKLVTSIPDYYRYSSNFRGYVFPKKTQTSQNRGSYDETITTYIAENLPSMKEEEYMDNVSNYLSSIEHELAMIQPYNGQARHFSTTWEKLVQTIHQSSDFTEQLKKEDYFKDDVTKIIAGLASNEEKAAAIFNHVKNTMVWNKYTGVGVHDGVKEAYKNKTGNSGEINLMLTAMLRYAGINASPVIVSTKDNGIPLYPSLNAYNYVIAAIESLDNITFLDATDKNASSNILPIRVLNGEGRIIRKDGSTAIVDLMPKTNSRDIKTVIASIDKDGKLSGIERDQYFDYNALAFRTNHTEMSQDKYLENMEDRYKGLQISDYKIANDKDLSQPVIESYNFTHDAVGEVIADKIYFSPMLFFSKKENPFKQEKREYPVDFVFPHQDKYTFTINIPDGYVIESLPTAIAMSMEDNLGSFKFNIGSKQNQIQIMVTMDINKAKIVQTSYGTLKSFFAKMIEKQNEKIVLRKA